MMITNPEDTGIFNPRIKDWVDAAHAVGALACYDQANANGILGITRARDAGFDVCHFNLHKTFSTPHACGGPGAGASAVSEELAPFLPGPRRATRDGDRFFPTPTGRSRSARWARSSASSRTSSAPTPGSWRSAPRGSARSPRSPC